MREMPINIILSLQSYLEDRRVMSHKKALISQLSGKFQALGVLVVLAGVIMSASGVWWGPAVLLPGVLLLIIGWF